MAQLFDIALKDLQQIFRDRRSLLFLVAMPLIFTLFMGVAYRGAAETPDTRLAVGWVNNDPGGIVSQALHDSLLRSESVRLVEMAAGEGEQASRQVASGKLAAALVVPAGFSPRALAGEAPQIALIADPAKEAGNSALQILYVPVTRLMSAAEIARQWAGDLPAGQAAGETEAAFAQAMAAWQEMEGSGPQIVLEKAQAKAASGFDLKGNPYNQTSPGILMQFAVFSLVASASVLVLERTQRTMERMLTTSVSRATIIAGHLLAMFAVVFGQSMMLVIFGQVFLKVDYFREPLGTLLVLAALSLWAASMGLFIGVLARSDEQVVLFSLIAMFVFSGLGGAWFPLEGSGPVFTTIGKLTPGAWAMTGLQNLLLRGLDSASTLLPSAVLLAYAALFFLLGVGKFRKG